MGIEAWWQRGKPHASTEITKIIQKFREDTILPS